jgi:hypothetical protein
MANKKVPTPTVEVEFRLRRAVAAVPYNEEGEAISITKDQLNELLDAAIVGARELRRLREASPKVSIPDVWKEKAEHCQRCAGTGRTVGDDVFAPIMCPDCIGQGYVLSEPGSKPSQTSRGVSEEVASLFAEVRKCIRPEALPKYWVERSQWVEAHIAEMLIECPTESLPQVPTLPDEVGKFPEAEAIEHAMAYEPRPDPDWIQRHGLNATVWKLVEMARWGWTKALPLTATGESAKGVEMSQEPLLERKDELRWVIGYIRQVASDMRTGVCSWQADALDEVADQLTCANRESDRLERLEARVTKLDQAIKTIGRRVSSGPARY